MLLCQYIPAGAVVSLGLQAGEIFHSWFFFHFSAEVTVKVSRTILVTTEKAKSLESLRKRDQKEVGCSAMN